MDRKIKVIQYGCGKMSVYTMRYVYEKGAEIVGAFDINPEVIGQDIGQIMGTENKGVIVQNTDNIEEKMKLLNADICIVATMSLMLDVKDIFLSCARLGINAISTCEEAIYPWNSTFTTTSEIDRIAKENNCTICGSGYQDIFWGNLITVLGGATHTITKIKGKSSYNVEDYGIALAKAHGAGLTLEEFEKQVASADNISNDARQELINKEEFSPSYMWNVNGWLCSKLGLHVTNQTQKCIPQTHDTDLESSTLGITVKAGVATGMSAVVTTNTEEGIILETECIGKVYAPEEFDKNEWTIYGEPDTTVVISKPATVELTCATVVNRIPDVLNAEAGYTTTEKMPILEYRLKPLNEYVK